MPSTGEAGHPDLLHRLRVEIRRDGPISFARFMELALYDETAGYYASSAERLGPGGDYVTASDAGPAFGRCIAHQIREIDETIGPLRPFDIVEFASGRGLLARDVLAALSRHAPDLASRVRYTMVDRSPAMREAARRLVPEAEVVAPEDLGPDHCGCVLAIELFDALPVHRVRRGTELREIRVDLDAEGHLVEREASPEPAVEAWARRYAAAEAEGSEAEVCLELAPQLDRLAAALERGVLLVVDYGDRTPALYGPRHRRGTLLAYRHHATNEEFLAHVGEQDLTAHVNFSALEDRAREIGVAVLGLTTQDRFLVANGLLEEFESRSLDDARDPGRVRARLAAMDLLHPQRMGRAFRVLALSKGCSPPPRLRGLEDPFAR